MGAIAFAGIFIYFLGGIYWIFKRKRMTGMTPATLILGSVLLAGTIANRAIETQSTSPPEDFLDDFAKLTTITDNRRFDDDGFLIEDLQPINTESK